MPVYILSCCLLSEILAHISDTLVDDPQTIWNWLPILIFTRSPILIFTRLPILIFTKDRSMFEIWLSKLWVRENRKWDFQTIRWGRRISCLWSKWGHDYFLMGLSSVHARMICSLESVFLIYVHKEADLFIPRTQKWSDLNPEQKKSFDMIPRYL